MNDDNEKPDQPDNPLTPYDNNNNNSRGLTLLLDGMEETSANTDFVNSRNNLLLIIEQGGQAMEELLRIAKASQDPEAFAAFASMTKTMVTANQKLIDIHRQIREINHHDATKGANNAPNGTTLVQGDIINNNLIVTPKKLQEMLKNAMKSN